MSKSKALQRTRKNKALKLFQAGKLGEAKSLLASLCCKTDRVVEPECWCLLGVINGQIGDYQEAIRCCKIAVEKNPNYAEAYFNLGQAYMHTNRAEDAAKAYRHVIILSPNNFIAHLNLGHALEWAGEFSEAIDAYQKALFIDPASFDALTNLGTIYQSVGYETAAIEALRRAVSIKPNDADARITLGTALLRSSDLDGAVVQFEKARIIAPDNKDVIVCMAAVQEKKGNYIGALKLIQPLLESGVENERLALVFALLARPLDLRAKAIEMLEKIIDACVLKKANLRAVHFQLGQLYDELERFDMAFSHFELANSLMPACNDPEKSLYEMDRVMHVCTRQFFQRATTSGQHAESPIFIIGMPRSGTTLTEQILASHPDIYGGGERWDIPEIVDQLSITNKGESYLDRLSSMDESLLTRYANDYLNKVAVSAGSAKRITDKLPHNFMHLGLIALLFPKARVIHCHRNSMDTCLSIFSNDLNLEHSYATSLQDLGQHYVKYQKLMAHWKRELPLPIFEVPYERMVAEHERVVRELVEFCGLQWNDACLKFYESKRATYTLSYNQVRRPVYSKSVGRWKNYSSFLEPLRILLEEQGKA